MIVTDRSDRTALHDAFYAAPSGQLNQPSESPSFLTSTTVIKQEANLLRFPFFALGRKGLRNRKGLLIRGESKLDGQSYDFEYRITCNSDDLYPGQLSRKVHVGLLRLLQSKQSFPYANPIEFTWRELMEAIGLVASGRTQQQIKQAIRSTHGTRIRSTFALKNGYGKHLKGRERGYGLYSEYVFFDELMPDDEKTADKNFVWLADWYLANINSLYCSPLNHGLWLACSPLNHGLWLALDNASPIASRMYEFFTFNFAGDWRTLTIDYDKLRRFLPVAPEKHLSQIKKQLGKALGFVVEAGVLAEANWQQGKRGQPQLVVVRGRVLAKRGPATEWTAEPDELNATEIRDLYRQNRPEDELVSQFHSLWEGNDQYHATSTDRARAKEVLTAYGSRRAEKLLPLVVELLREHFPKAKSFGATSRYWSDAAKSDEHKQAVGDRRKQEFIDHQLAVERRRLVKTRREQLDETWGTLPADEQQAIRTQVLASHPSSMKLEKYPRTLHKFCLEELGKRTAAA